MRRDLPLAARNLPALIRERLRHDDSVLVAIDGAAGLGKTTLANILRREFPGQATVLHADDYLAERHERFAQRLIAYDPRAIDLEALRQDINALSQGRDVIVRPYQHPTGTHSSPVVVPSRPLLIVEGAHTLTAPDHLIGVFIDGTENAMYHFRRERDVRERHASPATFDTWWNGMNEDYHRYVEINRENATVVTASR